MLVEKADDRLGHREIAGAQEYENAVTGPAPELQLLELSDIVDTGIRARIGAKDQAALEAERYGVCHAIVSEPTSYCCWLLCC
jgi:hypothetical protein